jgi:hypothetical protein
MAVNDISTPALDLITTFGSTQLAAAHIEKVARELHGIKQACPDRYSRTLIDTRMRFYYTILQEIKKADN